MARIALMPPKAMPCRHLDAMNAVEAQDVGSERAQTHKDARIIADAAGVLGEATFSDVVRAILDVPVVNGFGTLSGWQHDVAHEHPGTHHRGHHSGRRDWITGLRAPAIKALLASGALQLSLFGPARHGLHHGARVPRRASGGVPQSRISPHSGGASAPNSSPPPRAISSAFRQPSRAGASIAWHLAEIALAVGAVINRHKMDKNFALDISDTSFSFARKDTEITAEAATDGIYAVRTSLPAESFADATTVRSYKSLALVARAFRCIKTVDLQVRPVAGRSGARA